MLPYSYASTHPLRRSTRLLVERDDDRGEILGKEQDFQHAAAEVQLAGQPALMFKYSYTHQDGQARTGVAIAVTSPTSGLSYALAAQAVATDFDSQADTFDTILASLTIE